MKKIELYGSNNCRYTAELIEELEWQSVEFSYYDVEKDVGAMERMLALTGLRSVPVLVEDGVVARQGYQGRSCMV